MRILVTDGMDKTALETLRAKGHASLMDGSMVMLGADMSAPCAMGIAEGETAASPSCRNGQYHGRVRESCSGLLFFCSNRVCLR